MLLFLLAASLVDGAAEDAPRRLLDGEEHRRALTTSPQNMCGPTYGDALNCGAACPGVSSSFCITPNDNAVFILLRRTLDFIGHES